MLTASEQAYRCLCELLRTNQLSAGDFVSISSLAKQTDYPMAAMREAVQKAATLGLFTTVPKRGILVMEATPAKIAQLLDVRRIFDEEGIRRLSAQPDHPQLTEMIERHRAIQSAAAKEPITPALQQAAMSLDWDFHALLAQALDNPEAELLYAQNREKLTVMYNTRPILPDRIAPAFEEHIQIMQAILDGRLDTALQEITQHYQQIRRWWGIL